jgi:hypothetical protein
VPIDPEKVWAEFEEQGEDFTRLRLHRQDYGDRPGHDHKRDMAEDWLRRKEAERAGAINERQTTAAEDQAKYARRAYGLAIGAFIVSVISLIVAALKP